MIDFGFGPLPTGNLAILRHLASIDPLCVVADVGSVTDEEYEIICDVHDIKHAELWGASSLGVLGLSLFDVAYAFAHIEKWDLRVTHVVRSSTDRVVLAGMATDINDSRFCVCCLACKSYDVRTSSKVYQDSIDGSQTCDHGPLVREI
jgi:hypothetical protein